MDVSYDGRVECTVRLFLAGFSRFNGTSPRSSTSSSQCTYRENLELPDLTIDMYLYLPPSFDLFEVHSEFRPQVGLVTPLS